MAGGKADTGTRGHGDAERKRWASSIVGRPLCPPFVTGGFAAAGGVLTRHAPPAILRSARISSR